MCGIFGIVTTKSRSELIEPVSRALNALAHRGPDDHGVEFISDERDGLTVAFAHHRLSVLDLSSAGHQPMRDEATGDWITYNGEVFNFRDLRRDLVARGLRFQSECDTEVMLKGFGARGRDAIADWRGMFAFGFWNARRRSLTLVRDRLGVKPLYYYHDGDTFIFASEVRALLATGLTPRKISPSALSSYLAWGSVEQPLTIIENVHAVLPGHILEFKDGRVGVEAYWELRADKQKKARDERELIEELGALLDDSVKSHLVSDVPVGVFLSGGIDSSSVTALASRGVNSPIKSFSVCFDEGEFGETGCAEKIARTYGADHCSILVTEDEILSSLPEALRAMDQPSIDGLDTFIVSRAAAGAGMKVALSGLGGDEVFAGHDFFNSIAREEQLRNRVKAAAPRLLKAAASAIGAFSSIDRSAKLNSLLRGDQINEHSVNLRRHLFTAGQRLALMLVNGGASPAVEKWNERQMSNCMAADPINQASALELGGYLGNALLRDTDSMSMAHGLEVRAPLIDHKVVEKMLAVPGRLKLRGKDPKWMLMDAVGGLPREVVDRAKRGFELPFKNWLAGALRDRIESALWSPQLTKLLSITAMQEVWSDFLKGRVSWSRAWSLYVLGEWAGMNL
ncbi:MAG TPA: asparagine synthase (glutamine-hydrolyzing) [Blastocatellia bacterium]|jgi:asparagine synthase (glutamine-hydrolysing)|nr:asparagine synthase (glutamine-hydrolyzing) [Blastocatellia bacterium]